VFLQTTRWIKLECLPCIFGWPGGSESCWRWRCRSFTTMQTQDEGDNRGGREVPGAQLPDMEWQAQREETQHGRLKRGNPVAVKVRFYARC
jgi:hypothetical protein